MANDKSLADELLKLHELKERGVISQAEYDEKKALLLERSRDRSSTAETSTAGPDSFTKTPGSGSGCLGTLVSIVVITIGLILLLAIGGYFWFSSQTPSDGEQSGSGSTIVKGQSGQNKASSAIANPWTYGEIADAMHDTKTKRACTTSTNEVRLDFPYENTVARLCIRKGPKVGLDSLVILEGNGQILCGIESCTVHVRFDKGAVQSFPAVGAADNSTNAIFIKSTPRLINALRKSSVTVIELQFYQAGSQELIFNTRGLKWP